MQKIVYSITKIGKTENQKISGMGYIIGKNIVVAQISKDNHPFVRIFEGAAEYCLAIPNTDKQFRGAYSEIVTVKDHNAEINYFIWYKLID